MTSFSLEAKSKACNKASCHDSVKHAALTKGYVTSSNELVILPVFWVPAWSCAGFISTVGNMLVADLVCSHCVWRYACAWAMLYMSDSGRVTLWCMLQAGVSNHVVGILDDRASVALPGP